MYFSDSPHRHSVKDTEIRIKKSHIPCASSRPRSGELRHIFPVQDRLEKGNPRIKNKPVKDSSYKLPAQEDKESHTDRNCPESDRRINR